MGWQSFIALSLSFLITALIKGRCGASGLIWHWKGAVRKTDEGSLVSFGALDGDLFHYHAVSVHNAVAVIALDPAGSYGQPVTHLSWLSLSFGLFGRLFRRNDLGAAYRTQLKYRHLPHGFTAMDGMPFCASLTCVC